MLLDWPETKAFLCRSKILRCSRKTSASSRRTTAGFQSCHSYSDKETNHNPMSSPTTSQPPSTIMVSSNDSARKKFAYLLNLFSLGSNITTGHSVKWFLWVLCNAAIMLAQINIIERIDNTFQRSEFFLFRDHFLSVSWDKSNNAQRNLTHVTRWKVRSPSHSLNQCSFEHQSWSSQGRWWASLSLHPQQVSQKLLDSMSQGWFGWRLG